MTDQIPTSQNPAELGEGLCFLIGPFRGGTTLLRKMLDSHSRIVSPAETWFLLPLLNLWEGQGQCPRYNPAQAAAALRGHLSQEQFIDCVRAFAHCFYAAHMDGSVRWFVDKTPPYLTIAPALAQIFPRARFIILARDPRALATARHTWKHANSPSVESRFAGVAGDLARLASLADLVASRAQCVRYEDLCRAPEETCRRLCDFLEVPFEAKMIRYGGSPHDEGYGDENTRLHDAPHTDSLERWREVITPEQSDALLARCDAHALERLGYGALLRQPA